MRFPLPAKTVLTSLTCNRLFVREDDDEDDDEDEDNEPDEHEDDEDDEDDTADGYSE